MMLVLLDDDPWGVPPCDVGAPRRRACGCAAARPPRRAPRRCRGGIHGEARALRAAQTRKERRRMTSRPLTMVVYEGWDDEEASQPVRELGVDVRPVYVDNDRELIDAMRSGVGEI